MSKLFDVALNGSAIGIVMKEALRRAVVAIRSERLVYEVTQKQGYSGKMDDISTTADLKAQEIYVKILRECFPGIGIIAEEGELKNIPEGGYDTHFTVDPLDGTKAYDRGQSQGVGSMISAVENGEVVAAYVGDVNTLEIYGYRPGSDKVHRISEYNVARQLGYSEMKKRGYILLRDRLEDYALQSRSLLHKFDSYSIEGGSIGIWMARIWKREMVAGILPPGNETPWDSTPIIGITEKLGYRFYRHDDERWVPIKMPISQVITERDYDLLVIHPLDAKRIGGNMF